MISRYRTSRHRQAGNRTRGQREAGSVSSALLTFSLLLLVVAFGFVFGRLVIARTYVKAGSPLRKGPAGLAVPGGSATAAPRAPQAPAPQAPELGEEAPGSASAPPSRADSGPDASGVPPDQETTPRASDSQGEAEDNTSARETRYAVQVGVFGSQESARQVESELARAGYRANVRRERRGSRSTYKVLTEGYRTEAAADDALEALQRAGFSGAFVVADSG